MLGGDPFSEAIQRYGYRKTAQLSRVEDWKVNHKKIMKKSRLSVPVLFVVGLALLSSPIVFSYLFHNIVVWRFTKQLGSSHLIADMKALSSTDAIARYNGFRPSCT